MARVGPTHYQTLGVSQRASKDQIKKAYRQAVLKTHPDKAGDSPTTNAATSRLNDAYKVLSNPRLRCVYDASLPPPTGAPRPTAPRPSNGSGVRTAVSAYVATTPGPYPGNKPRKLSIGEIIGGGAVAEGQYSADQASVDWWKQQ